MSKVICSIRNPDHPPENQTIKMFDIKNMTAITGLMTLLVNLGIKSGLCIRKGRK